MPDRELDRISFEKGFWPNQALIPGIAGTLIDGQNVWVRSGGLVESSKGLASAGSAGAGITELMNVGGTHGGMTASGSGLQYFGAGTYFFAGSGSFYVGGASIGAAGSSVTIKTAAGVFNAGLSAPGAPTVSDSGVSGKNNGSYSVALTKVRTTTGAESTRSSPSLPLSVKNKKITITIPAATQGEDKIGVYCSRRGFGTTGPWFHLSDVPVGVNVTLDWYDGELGDLAPLDNNVPPACTHCFAINNVIVAAGSYGGSGLSPSKPSFPEAYPPDFTVFLPGSGSITSCKATGFEGTVLVATATSLNQVRATGSSLTPIQVQQLWPNQGFQSGSAWCIVEDQIWGFTGQRGAVRSTGDAEPDTTFAEPVTSFFAANGYSAANTVVGYDPKTDCVIFASGTVALPYCRHTGLWSPKQTLSFTVRSSVTVNGQLLLEDASGNLYSLESGSGTTWSAQSAWRDGNYAGYPKTIVGLRGAVSASTTLDLYTNMGGASQASKTAAANHGTFHHLNVQRAYSYSVKASGSDAGGTGVYAVETQYVPHPVRV